jgi:membrane protein YdbS with pleckstrin-like domain
MFKQDALLEYLSSPEGINNIIVGIILVGAINAIFITYSVRRTYWAAKIEREQLKIQQAKIEQLSPKKK